MDITVHVCSDPNEKNKRHGDPKGPVQIGSLEFRGFRCPHDVVAKMFRLVKMQKGSTDSLDNIVRINVKVDLVGIQRETSHAASPPRERAGSGGLLLLLLLLLHLWLRLRSHESRGHVGIDGRRNLLLWMELLLGCELLLLWIKLLLRLELLLWHKLLLLLDRWGLSELLLLLDGWRLSKLLMLLHHGLLHHGLLLLWRRRHVEQVGLPTTVDPKGIRPKVIVVQRRVHHLVEWYGTALFTK
mmetsp:Transcript_14384/g.29775  ORF Transcript_14384/g.29775 Transcript_14384/m.29775 type:complete len:242 (+) Transcript_14384:715-1440(+)